MKSIVKFKVTEGRYGDVYYDSFYLTGGIDHITKSEVTCNRSGLVSCLNIIGDHYAVVRYSVIDDEETDEVNMDINLVNDNKVTSFQLHYDGSYLNSDYHREYIKEFVFSLINGANYDMLGNLRFPSIS